MSNRPEIDAATAAYVARLEASLDALPDDERESVIADVRQHIDDARRVHDPSDASAAQRILDQLGSPEAIAAGVREETAVPVSAGRHRRARLGAMTAAALALLAVGGFGERLIAGPNSASPTQSAGRSVPFVVGQTKSGAFTIFEQTGWRPLTNHPTSIPISLHTTKAAAITVFVRNGWTPLPEQG